MQGVVFLPENLQQDLPPPYSEKVMDMEESLETNEMTKESSVNQSDRSDSGVFSATPTAVDQSINCDSDHRSDCNSPERKYVCPICDRMLTSQHNFTLHIRSHNNESEDDNEKNFTCKICHKILSSSSSLDRHVLVHSGERPFHCKYCGDTFTTNGNMHRHMRTHTSKGENYESDGSTDSSSAKSIEFNNNKINTKCNSKRKFEAVEESNNKKRETLSICNDGIQSFKCPVCERSDFNSVDNLEAHLIDNHPEYPVKCIQCNQIFLNNKQLNIHKSMVHETNILKQSIIGFKDLTFVDFSSEKFPLIAKRECEINLHKAAGNIKFQCEKCSKAFPCSISLEIHEKNCSMLPKGLNLCKNKAASEDEIRRAEFFSHLNLQDNSPKDLKQPSKEASIKLKEQLAVVMDNTKDLADIQSILTNINMQQLNPKQNDINIKQLKLAHETSNTIPLKNEQEEESQDSFALEFRKMKLKGEFPCRLCTAVFPNLRALKGHNRAHLNGSNNGTYYCNMCSHSSIDKAALIRHMRTHNGDRPYECSLCNYAFTTKANCERHLRNRHSKTTREEVKKAIIYHPSEDPTNEDVNKLTLKEESKKHNIIPSSESCDLTPERIHCSTPKMLPTNKADLSFHSPALIPDLQVLRPPKTFSNINFFSPDNIKSSDEKSYLNDVPSFFPQPFNLTIKVPSLVNNNIPSTINVNDYQISKDNYVTYNSKPEKEDINKPLMDVALDLSKKKSNKDRNWLEEGPKDLSKKDITSPASTQTISSSSELFAPQKIDHTAFYLANLYRSGFSVWPGFPVNPLLFQALPTVPRNSLDLKERIQRFQQLCGGSMIAENVKHMHDRNQILHSPQPLLSPILNVNEYKLKQEMLPELNHKKSFSQPFQTSSDDKKPLNIESSFSENIQKKQNTSQSIKLESFSSPNSVKMVIKNGILMPKQKQRRYRTERPFICEHCSARFTLRSNMERHIKQQHPQFWSQRQRGNIGQPGRKLPGMLLQQPYCDLPMQNFDETKFEEHDDSTQQKISEKLKFALLKLKTNPFNHDTSKEDDEECALIIDEKESNKINENSDQNNMYEKRIVFDEKLKQKEKNERLLKSEDDLVPVARLLDNASQQPFKDFFNRESDEHEYGGGSEEDEGLVASESTSEENISGTDENKSESDANVNVTPAKKKSAYSLAPNRVSCPYCSRKFPWTSSLRRHILTHTGQKPYKCSHCPLLFTTKSNCDRHLLRKHGNTATTVATSDASVDSLNYLIRNVPERPFKCSSCPSSTFSTYLNLKKHIGSKHLTNAQDDDIKAQGYEAGSSEDEKVNQVDTKNNWDNHSSCKFTLINSTDVAHSGNPQITNLDLPFKCHLCDGSFAERQDAIDHIRDKHSSEYNLLLSKNALDINATTPDDVSHHDDEDSDIRGKFPDYSNRKVICAWCMRRFWSAEDLRRHMRTHTGERPFSCDICRRRFTLKHSMLRHRKKHSINSNFEADTTHSDEEGIIISTDKFNQDETDNSVAKAGSKNDDSDTPEGGSDLISKLLGLRDKSIIDKALDASADDAAKLLGVKNGAKK